MPNLDLKELVKFETFGKQWWNLNGDYKALHDINPLRVAYIDKRSSLKNNKVLDVGCGGGILSEALARRGAEVTGIDAGRASLSAAAKHARGGGLSISYHRSTAEAFADTCPGHFDIVTCMELLEHVPDPASIVTACSRLVKNGGDIFFATLNRNPKSFLFAIIGAEYLLKLVRRGTHTYRRFIKPAELKAWGEAAGAVCSDATGLHYNPFLRRYHLGGNLHVNYLMHFIKK